MDASKEGLIQRLLNEGKITQDEAFLLRKKERKEVVLPKQQPYNPFPQIGRYPFPINQPIRKTWIEDEMEKRQRIAENCPCNPANGGSGMCNCTLTGPVITC